MNNKEKAKILRKAAELLELLNKFVQQKSEPACQARREAFRFLVKYLWLLNEVKGSYGIHGPLEEPLRQLEYLANKSQTKDLGTYVSLDRDITQSKMSDSEQLSFIEQLNLWANKIELHQLSPEHPAETQRNNTPSKGSRIGSWLWKLYEKSLKVIVDAFLERVWPK